MGRFVIKLIIFELLIFIFLIIFLLFVYIIFYLYKICLKVVVTYSCSAKEWMLCTWPVIKFVH